MSSTMPKEIATAILEVMGEVGYVQKKGTNSFQNYKYASIEGVLEKVQPALVKCGLLITQNEVSHAIVAEDQMMEATYAFGLTHKSGAQAESITLTSLSGLRNSKGGYDDKALNKCHTAARKYFILGLFQIPTGLAADPDDDEDRPTVDVSGRAPAPQPQANGARTAAPNGKNGKTTAEDWAGGAMEAVNTAKDMKELTAWIDRNQPALEKLKDTNIGLSNKLKDLIDDRYAALSPIAAG